MLTGGAVLDLCMKFASVDDWESRAFSGRLGLHDLVELERWRCEESTVDQLIWQVQWGGFWRLGRYRLGDPYDCLS